MVVDDFCIGCVFHSRAHNICNYLLVMDVRRGCPGGAECDKKMTKEEFYAMGMQKDWNKQAGKAMWAAGRGDAEIAKAMGVTQGTISYYRRRHWERECDAAPAEEQLPPVMEQQTPVEEIHDSEPDTMADVEAPVDERQAAEDSPAPEVLTMAEAMKRLEQNHVHSPDPILSATTTQEGPGAAKTEDLYTGHQHLIHALEGATSNLTGMDAVMTAQIISALWCWTDKSDLLEAKACLDYLIRRHQ